MLKRLLFLLFLLPLYVGASYWDQSTVRSYTHHSELQRRWAWSFLAPHLKKLQGNERILDVGCGDGKITADIAKFVPDGSVIGVDPSTHMLAWAYGQYHPIEYPNLTFRSGTFHEMYVEGHFDLIISFCALQHCSDVPTGLNHLASRLNPGGKLLILVPAMSNGAWNQAFLNLQSSPKWAHYWKPFPPRRFLSPEQYIELLSSTDLSHVKVKHVKTFDPFIDRLEMLDWVQGTFPPIIPPSLAREFYNELIDEYLRLQPDAITEDGVIYAQFGVIQIKARKKL